MTSILEFYDDPHLLQTWFRGLLRIIGVAFLALIFSVLIGVVGSIPGVLGLVVVAVGVLIYPYFYEVYNQWFEEAY